MMTTIEPQTNDFSTVLEQTTTDNDAPPVRNYSKSRVLLIFSVPALGGSLFGYDIGATSFSINQIIEQGNHEATASWVSWVGRSPSWQGLIVAAASLGALLGSIWILGAADRLGRRQELRLGSYLYMLGALLQVLGPSRMLLASWWGLLCFVVGRLVFGVAIGITMHGAPTYLAEQCPSPVRGLVVSCKEAAIVLGILLGYAVGDYCSSAPRKWQDAYAFSLFLSLPMWALSFTIPRSCRWLLLKGRTDEALESLRFIWREQGVAQQELQAMRQALPEQPTRLDDSEVLVERGDAQETTTPNMSVPEESSNSLLSSWFFLWDPRYRAPLVAGVGLVILQQVTGQPSVLSYATPIFRQAGLSKESSVLVAAFKLVATLTAAATVENWGRKKLLYIGCSMMLSALVVLSLTIGNIKMEDDTEEGDSPLLGGTANAFSTRLILFAMFAYIGGYQFSFGPISWLMISEVFPLQVRGQAVAFAVQMNFFWNAVVQFGVPVLSSLIGLNVTFGIFAVLTAYSIYFVRVNVPETKGLSLEEIERQFKELEDQRRGRSATLSPVMEPLLPAEDWETSS